MTECPIWDRPHPAADGRPGPLPVLLYGLTVLGPVLALIAGLLLGDGPPPATWPELVLPTGRRLALWLRSIGLATSVAVCGLTVGTLVALRLRRHTRWAGWPWLFAMLAALPPMTHALAWSWVLARTNLFLRGAGMQALPTSGWLIAGWVQFTWLVPLAVAVSLVAVDAVPTDLLEAAHLLHGSVHPLMRVLLPLAGPLLLAGGGVLFLLSLLDYGIPSIFQVNVLALDVFADFSVHGQADRALLVSVPLLAATVGAITLSQGRLRDAAMAPPVHGRKAVTTERWPRWLVALSTGAVAIVMPAVLGPIVSLAAQVGSWQQLSAVLDGGRGEIVYSFGVSLAAALLSLPLAAIAAQRIVGGTPLGRAWWLAVTLPMALPGPLVGIGLIRLWNSPVIAFTSVYGSRWMPVLAALARYVPLGALVMTAALRRTDPSLIDAARVLQASRRRRLVLVHLPMLAPGLLAAGAVVFCLTLGELSATLLVAAPGHPTLSMRIYNYLHYGASDTVAGLTLAMTALVLTLGAITVLVQTLWARLTDIDPQPGVPVSGDSAR